MRSCGTSTATATWQDRVESEIVSREKTLCLVAVVAELLRISIYLQLTFLKSTRLFLVAYAFLRVKILPDKA